VGVNGVRVIVAADASRSLQRDIGGGSDPS